MIDETKKIDTPSGIQESTITGEKIIFDIVIKQKLTHVIVITDGTHYHINLNGEDLGSFTKEDDGKISRYGQPRGAADDYEDYFKPIELKLKELNR
ncbi:MAG: hypothetical protein EOP00_33940 [Pedobacter sp.]|nr:MAG: hypothetical protein EOP00_33940 [Pedobacter sp.]